jgi:putative DNA primase/helicase
MIGRKIKQQVRNILNLFAHRKEYRPAHCGNIRTLLLHLCDMDEEMCTWVLRWLAFPLRNPGARMSTALVFNGSRTGISLFCEQVVARLYGYRGRVISGRQLLDGVFLWFAHSHLVVVDGTFSDRHATRLKELMTAPLVMSKTMRDGLHQRPNKLNFLYASSSLDLLPEDLSGQRRFVIVEAPPERQRAFYVAIGHEIENGGVEAFLGYLMRDLNMGDFHAGTMPPTPARKQLRAA